VETAEKLRWRAEFLPAQGRNFGQHCVDAQFDDGLMNWPYSTGSRERAFVRPILKPRVFMPYIGGRGVYREKCEAIAAAQYPGFTLSGDASQATDLPASAG
jgi:hypothetical protein